MAFRGFGDDALKVKADKREAALKAAQIAASERASMRSANVQMAGLQENARQADMANQRAGEQLAAGSERFDKQLAAGNERFDKQLAAGEAARMDGLALKREGMAADEAYRRDSLAATEAARKDDLSVKIADMSLRERQLQLNESTAAKLDAEWKQQQAAQEEMQREDTATQLAVIRAASLSSGPVGMPYINALNDLRGVAYGDPGSTTQVFPVIDPQTGARLGIGTVKIGEDGKEIQSILDPAAFLPQVRKSMAPEKWEEYARQLTGANTAKGSDRVTAAAIREMQKSKLEFAKSDPASLVKTLAEQEDNLRLTKPPKTGTGKAADPANQENLDRVGRIKTNVLKELEAQLGGVEEEATPAANLTPEQRAFVTKPGTDAGAAAGTADTGATINKEAGTVTVKIGDQTRTVPDTPALRDWLKERNIRTSDGAKPAPAQEKAPPAKPAEKRVAKGEDEKSVTSPFAISFTTPGLIEDQFVSKVEKPTGQPAHPATNEKKSAQSSSAAPMDEDTEKDVPKKRRGILSRLEKAYRLPNTPDKKQIIRKIKAELDAFNDMYPV